MDSTHSSPVARGACVHTRFEAVARRDPNAIAAVFEQERVTYDELNRLANRLADGLRSAGVKPGILVAIYLEPSLEVIIAILGVLKAGGAYVPVDTRYPIERITLMLQDAQPLLVITSREFRTKLSHDGKPGIIFLDQISDLKGWSSDDAVSGTTEDDLVYVIYTSGSSGIPKGVQVTHKSVLSLFEATQPLLQFQPCDVWTVFHSFGFDLSVWEIFGGLLSGGRLILVPRHLTQSTGEFWDLLSAERVSVLSQTPSALRQLTYVKRSRTGANTPDLALRHIICGGEALASDLALEILSWGIPLWNFYGPTEATVWVAAGRVKSGSCQNGPVPIGRPLSNATIFIVDSELRPVPLGETGELCIAGTALARGYLNRPHLTETKFTTAPFDGVSQRIYRTGDLGRYRPDGELEFLGRLDDQVKIRGFRVELGEIESALRRHPNVRECVVVAHQAAQEGQRLFAYVVYDKGALATPAAIRAFLRELLPEYMIPAAFVRLDKLPLNASGKIDRKAIRLPDTESNEKVEEIAAILGRLESQLVDIWSRILRVQKVGLRENFFDLGGDSVLAVELFCEIEKVCGKYLPLVTLLENQTIEELAAVIRGIEPESVTNSSLVPIRREGTETPLFLVHPVGGTILGFKDLLHHLSGSRPVYGLQSRGLNEEGVPFRRVEEMATYYVEQIRSVDPHGPYALVGLCFGAVVAYEMAQQILRAGQEVELLCMLDPDPPDYVTVEPPFRRRLQVKWTAFRNRSMSDRLPYLIGQAKNATIRIGESVKLRVLGKVPVPAGDVEVANFEAIRKYEPRPFPALVTIFRASERPETEYASQMDWRRYAPAGLAVEEVPGDHLSMMKEPYVRILASKLEARLQKASAAATTLCGLAMAV